MSTPQVGVGVILTNPQGEILLGKRCNSHAPFWALPGGKMELGETFEQTAIREVAEETGIRLDNVRLIALTNNLATYRDEGIHFISAILLTSDIEQQPQRREPDRCEKWQWYRLDELPEPLFEASRQALRNWQEGKFYQRA